MIAALGGEMSTGGAQKPQTGAVQNTSLPLPIKTAQQSLPAASETDATQASIARFRLDRDALLQREANVAADASFESTPSISLENSENSGKSIKHENSTQNTSEKKHATASTANAQSASQPSIAVAVPMPAALPPSAQPVNATAAQHVQSFLTDASFTAEHRTAPGLTNGIAPANGIATVLENGTPLDDNAAGIAQSASSAGETDGVSAHTQQTDSSVSTAGAPLTGFAPPADAAASNTNADGVNTDPISDSIADAESATSASTGSSIGLESAAHTIAAQYKRIVEQTVQRSAHGAADAAFISLQSHAPQVQPAGTAGDSSAFACDAATGHTAAGALPSGSIVKPGAAPGSQETFAALDGDAARGASWLHAGAHSAEAGFEDPALGWVSVRADMAAGSVHAAVVPGTAEAAQALSTHMAGLNTYLNEQRTPVHTLTLAAPGGDAGSNQDSNQGSARGGGQDSAYRDGSSQPGAQTVPLAAQAFAETARAPVETAPIAARAGTSISLIA